jgi:hypothetical protein
VTPALWFDIASGLLLFFACGHTIGFLRFRPASPEGQAVLNAMASVRFDVKGRSYTFGGFYRGFGWSITVYFLFSALLAWQLGSLAASVPQHIKVMAWGLTATQAVCVALSMRFFFLVPALMSLLTVAALACGSALL